MSRTPPRESCQPRMFGIMALHADAECEARLWRRRASLPGTASVILVVLAVVAPWLRPSDRPMDAADLGLEVLKVSVLLVAALVALFAARTVWNTSNVWLGRAGTLEDLALALKLIGKPMDYPRDDATPGSNACKPFLFEDALSRDDAERLPWSCSPSSGSGAASRANFSRVRPSRMSGSA
jgi:hypothetical protein